MITVAVVWQVACIPFQTQAAVRGDSVAQIQGSVLPDTVI